MAHGGPIRIVNTGKHILPRVNDGIVAADFWEEAGDPFAQTALGVLSDKQRDRGVFVNNLQHTVEKLCGVDGFRADPVHLLPVAHRIRVGGPVKTSGTDKVVQCVI